MLHNVACVLILRDLRFTVFGTLIQKLCFGSVTCATYGEHAQPPYINTAQCVNTTYREEQQLLLLPLYSFVAI